MRRGDLITIAMQGDFGKPRPALVIQTDLFMEQESVTVLPVTSKLTSAPLQRITIHPDEKNGLRKPSQVMIDKITTVKRSKTRAVFGCVGANVLAEVDRCLILFLGIAK